MHYAVGRYFLLNLIHKQNTFYILIYHRARSCRSTEMDEVEHVNRKISPTYFLAKTRHLANACQLHTG
jgi:hypothetical protein